MSGLYNSNGNTHQFGGGGANTRYRHQSQTHRERQGQTQTERAGGTKRKLDLLSDNDRFDTGDVDDVGCSSAISQMEEEPFEFFWTIKNASVAIMGINDFESPVFKGGLKNMHSWQMIVQPHADAVQDVGFYLRLVDFGENYKPTDGQGERKLRVRFEILIARFDGGPPLTLGCHGGSSKFYEFLKLSKEGAWGNSTQSKDLFDPRNGLVENDTIKLHLRAWIEGEWKHDLYGTLNDGIMSKCRRTELSLEMGNLFTSGKFADVTLSVEERVFPAHRAILAARSPVFEAMFANGMIESSKNSVRIADFDEEIVKSMLEYIYTGQTATLDADAAELIKIAEKYDIKGLKEDCEFSLVRNLKVKNAGEMLVLGDLYNAKTLKDKVVTFINKNKKKVAKTVSFKNVSAAYPHLVMDLYMS